MITPTPTILVAQERVTDVGNDRVVLVVVIGLIALGVLVAVVTVWFWRATRPDHEALAGLESLDYPAVPESFDDGEVHPIALGDEPEVESESGPSELVGVSPKPVSPWEESSTDPSAGGGGIETASENSRTRRRAGGAWVDALRTQVRAVAPPREAGGTISTDASSLARGEPDGDHAEPVTPAVDDPQRSGRSSGVVIDPLLHPRAGYGDEGE